MNAVALNDVVTVNLPFGQINFLENCRENCKRLKAKSTEWVNINSLLVPLLSHVFHPASCVTQTAH